MERWQQDLLLKNVNYLDFKGNQLAIYKAFEKVCEPLVGYKGCSFSENKLEMNNQVYTLIVDIDSIMITYSTGESKDNSCTYLIKKQGRFTREAYLKNTDMPNWHMAGDQEEIVLNYEFIVNRLMEMAVCGR